jgi:hypothetical protein
MMFAVADACADHNGVERWQVICSAIHKRQKRDLMG